MRTLTTLALLLSAAAGCASNDDIWMPPSSSGKADGVTFIKGSDIPSQYVDDAKSYLTKRRIAALEEAGAFDATMESVSDRADGILGASSRNGWLEASELVRMESLSTLFPEERDALRSFWKLLEAPDPDATTVEVPDTALTITDLVDQPAGALPTSLAITSLPTSLQAVAKRVELAYNADHVAGTIQPADVDAALAAPQGFTSTELTQLAQIKSLFTDGPFNSHAKAKVPAPGHHSKVTTLGQMKLDFSFDVLLREHRKDFSCTYGECGWTAWVELSGTQTATVRAPAGSALLVVDLDTGDEQVYKGSEIDFSNHSSGNVVLDRYEAGVRKGIYHVALPPMQPDAPSATLSNLLDYVLVTQDNQPLVKSPYAQTVTSTSLELEARFGKTANPSPGVDAANMDRLATPISSLTPGRYEVSTQWGPFVLDLYAEGVAIARISGQAVHLQPADIYGKRALVATGDVGPFSYVYFFPETNQLQVSSSTYTLSEARRIR